MKNLSKKNAWNSTLQLCKNLSLIIITLLTVTLTSCELPEGDLNNCDDGWGTLVLKNKSLHTVQKIIISGISYGTLDPGEKKEYKLVVGEVSLIMRGISGGNGCRSVSYHNIPDCGKVGVSCSY